MAFNAEDLISSPIARVRFDVGDTSQYPIFSDSVYDYVISKNSGDELVSSIEMLDQIIGTLIVSPSEIKVGDITEAGALYDFFTERLAELRARRYRKAGELGTVPLAIRSDRKNWNDIDSIFKGSNKL